MREIKLSAALQQGAVVWTASAVNNDGEAVYGSTGESKTALDALMLLAQQLYTRVDDLEDRLAEHYGA